MIQIIILSSFNVYIMYMLYKIGIISDYIYNYDFFNVPLDKTGFYYYRKRL